MTKTKDIILKLKEVKKEKGLSLDKILLLMEQEGYFLSKSTIGRVFEKGSENNSFRYEDTIIPLANVLLDVDNIETDDDPDTKAYKAMLKIKKELIQELKAELDQEKVKYSEKLAEETEKFQRSLDFATHQITLKDKRIDQLMSDNTKLVNHILDCPFRKNCHED